MKALRIINYLKLAGYQDVLTPGEKSIIENKEYFQKSLTTGKFEGPYLLQEPVHYYEFLVQLEMGMIYVLDPKFENESSRPFKMTLREAVASDLKETKKTLLNNLTFYLLINNETTSGPFYLGLHTNIPQLQKDLEAKMVYIIAKKQNFELIKTKITA